MISVIVPVYNLQKYIEKCIESIVSQTYRDLELILIDDGSEDKSLEICQMWAKRDKRIKVYHHTNQGVSAARNFGLFVMQGEFVAFVDGDDWIDIDAFARMMDKMTDNIDIVCCSIKVEKEDGCEHNVFRNRQQTNLITKNDCICDYYNHLIYTKTVWSKIYRRNLWENVRFENINNAEDSLAMFEIMKSISNIYFMEEKFYHYLQRKSSVTHHLNEKYYKDVLYVAEINFQTAYEYYPQYKEMSGSQFINIAYDLLKLYEEKHDKTNGGILIRHMKEIYNKAQIRYPSRAQMLLNAPVWFVFRLISLKRWMKGIL